MDDEPISQRQDKESLFGILKAANQRGFALIHKILFVIVIIVLIGIILLTLRWCSGAPKKPHRAQETTVVVAKAHKENIPVYLNALGAVTPTDTVTVITQVNGQLQKVFFKEGQMVKAGDLLAQIDERPFLAQLMQYEGQLAHDQAQLANAKIDLARYEALWKEDSISKQILDTQFSLVQQLEGTVKSDQGLVNTARVNLIFCRITSPINGRVGLRLVDPGNFVQTSNTTGLFVINNIRPITVVFTIPEDNVPQVMEQIRARKKLICEAYDRSQNKLLATGVLLTMDNQIDSSTGTVKLKAQFKNDDDSLFPNQFVNIKLLVKQIESAIVIPTPAVLHGAQGDFVYKVNPDQKTVKSVPIAVSLISGEGSVITSGVNDGDVVIAEGTDKLTDGASVIISNQEKPELYTTKNSASSKSK